MYALFLVKQQKLRHLVLKKDTEEKYLGGAGVVASHLKKLGSQVTFTTVIGKRSSR